MPFDPSQPFEAVATPEFDPNQPFEAVDQSRGAAAASEVSSPAGVGSIPTPATPTPEQAVAETLRIQQLAFGPASPLGATIAANRALSPTTPEVAGALVGAVPQPINQRAQKIEEEAQTLSRERGGTPADWYDVLEKTFTERHGSPEQFASEAAARSQATYEQRAHTPLISLPKPDAEGAGAGLRPVIESIEALSTLENALILGGLPGAPGVVQKAAGVYFGTTMGKQAAGEAVEAFTALRDGDLTKAGKHLATAGTLGLFTTGIGKHAYGERRTDATLRERAEASAQDLAQELRGNLERTDAALDTAMADAQRMAGAQPATTDAISKPEATQPNEPVLNAQGAPESTGKVPAVESGAGVPARGQGAPVRAQEVVPAISVEGKVVRGQQGETHQDVLKRYIAEHPEKEAEALVDFDTKKNPNFFMRGDERLSRAQLQEQLGVSDSQGLRELQAKVSPPAPDVAPHLKTDKAVQSILDEQPATPESPTMKAPEAPAEAGAAGGTGGRRPPPPKAIGVTPRGDPNWLRIPAWFRRIGRGLFTEGARHVLGRTRNQVGIALGRATRRHVDVEQELFGQHEKILRDALRGIPNNRQEALWTEVSQHVRDVENGRPAAPLAPDAQRVLDAWYEVGQRTGDIARANNVMVWDANLGAYRPMGTVTNYIPRMFSREVESALRDPERNPALFNSLAQAIATHRGIPLADAAAELNRVAGRFSSNDFHGNLELARLEQLPEIFYEYDLRNLASRYLPAFSERMAQIIAYGQRLGPREQPQRMNLWDIARRESRDETTQQWLNAAEDQATGFRPKNEFERNARRLQAIANATLLSDPTTTVVRNLISGLSVTAERFGVVRSLRSLREASRAASGMNAREIGALRDDIGSFLSAEQLGDSALDNLIRSGQQKALTAAGFSGSENFVRRHGAITASAFARDAANALATSPTSGLAREALRYFKSLDIDPELIVAEGGNWRTGPETRKFIRSSVRESQGGYRFDQVPIWGGSTVGRFLYQYGRWGIQRAGDIFRNTIRPAIGETVEFRGQRMTRRNLMPLIRLGMLTIGLGETFSAIAAMLFGRDRRDASLSEIGEAFSEDEARAVGLMGERIINDVLMAGTLGLIGQPVDYFKALKDQTRLKNPLDPPSIAGVKTLTDLATEAKDQGGTLTKRDLLDAASGLARGPKNVTDVARNVADEKLYEAQNDQRTLRNAARRWAKTQGMDVASKISFDTVRKSLNAPVFEAINDALLTGNPDKAKQLRDEFVNSKKTSAEKKKAREAVHSSVEGRHPFRAGPFTADKYRKQFTTWAEKNLPEQDREQIRRVIETYDRAAKDAEL